MAITFELAIPVILIALAISVITDRLSTSIESQSMGCMGGSLDFFDVFDSDD